MNGILVCDDEIDTHLFIEAALERYGVFEITDAWNGRQAIEKAEKNQPDLIIMDFKMPDMDGFEALKEIQKTANIPAIMLTGMNLDPGIKQDMIPYIVEYLVKPFAIDRLLDIIATYLKKLPDLAWVEK